MSQSSPNQHFYCYICDKPFNDMLGFIRHLIHEHEEKQSPHKTAMIIVPDDCDLTKLTA